MLRREKQVRAQVRKLLDAALFCIGLFLAHLVRKHWVLPNFGIELFGGPPNIQAFSEYVWLMLVIFPLVPFLLELQGFYQRPIAPSRLRLLWALTKVSAAIVLVVSFVVVLSKQELSRTVIILLGPASILLVMIKEEILRHYHKTGVLQAQRQKRFLLVGTKEDSARLVEEMRRVASNELKIVAQLNLNDHSVNDLVEALHIHSANGVLIAAKHTYFGQIEKAIQACEVEGIEAWLLADFFNTQFSQTILDDFDGRPLLIFRRTPDDSWQRLAKHALDVVGAALLLLLLSVPMLAVALAIKLFSPGPVLFRQQRSGLNGRPFTMLKFRSMVTNAEQRKQELEMFNEMSGPVFKLSGDPRVTPLGRFLRKYSIDELPQLVNVLRGEMSLVGPRPLPVDETRRFSDLAHRRRLSVRPGLTCLWQINGRSNVLNFSDWVRLDLEYIDNWSLWLDLKILLLTFPVVVRGSGAK